MAFLQSFVKLSFFFCKDVSLFRVLSTCVPVKVQYGTKTTIRGSLAFSSKKEKAAQDGC